MTIGIIDKNAHCISIIKRRIRTPRLLGRYTRILEKSTNNTSVNFCLTSNPLIKFFYQTLQFIPMTPACLRKSICLPPKPTGVNRNFFIHFHIAYIKRYSYIYATYNTLADLGGIQRVRSKPLNRSS